MPTVAYNPEDPVQQNFLSQIALGETGGAANAYTEGTSIGSGSGAPDLSGLPTDQYGFPLWSGNASTAAGAFQFTQATWDQYAQQYNLNWQNPADQNAAAWYLAQDRYAQATGGQDLEAALQQGASNPTVFSGIQSALSKTWTSVIGNMSLPGGLANALSSGKQGAPLAAGIGYSPNAMGQAGASSASSGPGGFLIRGGLIFAGAVVILVALWQLLSNTGAVPSPAKTVKTVGAAVAA